MSVVRYVHPINRNTRTTIPTAQLFGVYGLPGTECLERIFRTVKSKKRTEWVRQRN